MQFERRMSVVDSGIYETLDALLDAPFAICSVVTDSEGRALDCRVLRVSPHFAESMGLERPEGRTALDLVPGLDRSWVETLGRVALERKPARFVKASSRTGRTYKVSATPLDPPGCFAVAFREVAAPPEPEQDESQRLLKELGHRVMNSFASISAIVAMETRAASADARDALKRIQGRVQALAALYRRLDGAPEVELLEVAGYLAGNVQSLCDAFAPADLSVETDLAPMNLPTRAAIPLALLLNELLTDAASQALSAETPGRLRVVLREEGGQVCLSVEHGGGPLAAEGVGRSLALAFASELGGALTTDSTPEGSRAAVTFPA